MGESRILSIRISRSYRVSAQDLKSRFERVPWNNTHFGAFSLVYVAPTVFSRAEIDWINKSTEAKYD